VLNKFREEFSDRETETITYEEILAFLRSHTRHAKQSTKKLRYSTLCSFFNFIRNSLDKNLPNPCDSPILRKIFRAPKKTQWKIFEKEIVDEIIFRTRDPRNRLILELMARGGMRISEVLNIKPRDVEERKIVITEPKSGKETEVVFMPQKTAHRLKDYINTKKIKNEQRIFPITYPAARRAVMQAGELVGIYLRPHDLRRHSATYASRSGTPIEIVSKIILRHSNLSTTQRYLGKVSDLEAMRWIENLYG